MIKHLVSLYKGILAGLSIGIGSFLYVILTTYLENNLGLVLGSLAFSIGLFLVCTFKFNLYTGKIGLAFESKQNKDYFISLPIMYLGNMIGAIGLGYISYFIFKDNEEIFSCVTSICEHKLVFDSFGGVLVGTIKSTLCGLCVYLAVKCFSKDYLKPKGVFYLVFFVFVFVFAGFKHCVANMYYFGFGNKYTNYQAYIDLPVCTIFNTLGSFIGVSLYKFITKDSKVDTTSSQGK